MVVALKENLYTERRYFRDFLVTNFYNENFDYDRFANDNILHGHDHSDEINYTKVQKYYSFHHNIFNYLNCTHFT